MFKSKKSKKKAVSEPAPASFTQTSRSTTNGHSHVASRENVQPAQSQLSPPGGVKPSNSRKEASGRALEEQEAAFREGLPVGAKKLERGLSVSRSGRYKSKNKLRLSVMTDEIFADGPQGGASGTSGSLSGAFDTHARPSGKKAACRVDTDSKFKEMSLPSQSTATAL